MRPVAAAESIFLLAKLLSVRYAPVSERVKVCKGKHEKTKKPRTKQPNQTKPQTPNTKKNQNTTNTTNPFAPSETCER